MNKRRRFKAKRRRRINAAMNNLRDFLMLGYATESALRKWNLRRRR